MMPAKKGNKYAVGNSGKPKLFRNPKELQERIDYYFNNYSRYTVEGLCVFLGITRQTLLNYETEKQYKDYFDIVKIAKQKIFANLIERGLDEGKQNNSALTIFLLKNYGYTDKQEVEHSGGVSNKITITVLENDSPPLADDETKVN